jgi:hypothetical protein
VPNVAVYSIKIVSGSKRLIVRLFYKIYSIEDKIGTIYDYTHFQNRQNYLVQIAIKSVKANLFSILTKGKETGFKFSENYLLFMYKTGIWGLQGRLIKLVFASD